MANKLYPDIKWVLQFAPKELMRDYGKGYIITAYMGVYYVEYFILKEDPRVESWIHLIANTLAEKVEKDVR